MPKGLSERSSERVSIRVLRADLPVPALTYQVDGPGELVVIADRRLADRAVDTAVVAGIQALRQAGRRE